MKGSDREKKKKLFSVDVRVQQGGLWAGSGLGLV